mgnify:CR=1 FL=1
MTNRFNDRIDINKSRIDLSLAGLSDLVAGRPEIERDVDKKDTPAAPTKAKPLPKRDCSVSLAKRPAALIGSFPNNG